MSFSPHRPTTLQSYLEISAFVISKYCFPTLLHFKVIAYQSKVGAVILRDGMNEIENKREICLVS